MASDPRKAVADLAGRMPVANRRVADAVERARQTQIASYGGAAYNTGAQVSAGQVAAAGAGVTQQAGAQAAQGAAKNQETIAAPAGQAALQGMQQGVANQASEAGIGLSQQQRSAEDRLASLDAGMKRDLIDARMAFGRDENGRMVANTQQLADLAVVKARDATDLQRYKQTMDQATRKKISLLKTMYQKMEQELQNRTSKEIQDLEQSTKINIKSAMQDLQNQIGDRENELANRSMQYGAIAGLLGMVGGGVMGGPAGAAAGGSAGQKVGSGAAYA